MSKRVSGVTATLINKGVAPPPSGLYGRVGWLAQSGAAEKTLIFTGQSDETTEYAGDARLIGELQNYRLNAGYRANAIVHTGPAGHMDAANIPTLIDAVNSVDTTGVEGLVFDVDADLAFVTAVANELTSRATNKQHYVAFCRYRKALVLNLEGVDAVTEDAGAKTGIPAVGHGLEAGDSVIIYGSTNYDGEHVLDALTSVDKLVIPVAFVAETFAAGVELEETPESYLASFSAEFGTWNHKFVGVVIPTTQDAHLGLVAGVMSGCESIADEPGAVELFPLVNAAIDEDWAATKQGVIDALCEARGILVKRHAEDETNLYINRANMMSADSDDWDSLPMARLSNMVLREVRANAFSVVNSRKFPKTEVGAEMIARMAVKSFGPRYKAGELTRTEVLGEWNADGSIALAIDAQGPNYVPLVKETVTVTPDQGQ